MDPLTSVLSQLGLGVASNAIYSWLDRLNAHPYEPDHASADLQNHLNLLGVEITAETIIEALAENGIIKIEQSQIYANESILFGSVKGRASIGDGSAMSTKNTSIIIGVGASIESQGNAQIRQNPDGSITFNVGKD